MRWRPPRRAAAPIRASSACSSARPTRTWRSACDGDAVVQLDRLRAHDCATRPACVAKFGVPPASIPDYLALVGDSADGYPGLPGWGAKSAAAVLAVRAHRGDPRRPPRWKRRRGARRRPRRDAGPRSGAGAALRELATLRTDVPVFDTVDDLAYRGPMPEYRACGSGWMPPRAATVRTTRSLIVPAGGLAVRGGSHGAAPRHARRYRVVEMSAYSSPQCSCESRARVSIPQEFPTMKCVCTALFVLALPCPAQAQRRCRRASPDHLARCRPAAQLRRHQAESHRDGRKAWPRPTTRSCPPRTCARLDS